MNNLRGPLYLSHVIIDKIYENSTKLTCKNDFYESHVTTLDDVMGREILGRVIELGCEISSSLVKSMGLPYSP